MTRKSKGEIAILAGLMILLSISIFSQFSKESDIPATSIEKRSSIPANASSNDVLAVDLLQNQAPEFSGVKRNIFQFGPGMKTPIPQQESAPVPTPDPGVAEPPSMPKVQYLGFYYEKETGLKMASLSNSGRVYVGRIGQVLGGKYQVQEIASDQVILKLLMEDGKFIRVPLGKTPASYIEWNEDRE